MDSLDKNLGTLNPQVLGSSPRGRTTKHGMDIAQKSQVLAQQTPTKRLTS